MADPIIPVRDLSTQEVLYGDRTTEYRWEVLEHSNGIDQLVGILDGVSDGSLSWIQNAAVKGSGNLKVVDLDVAADGLLRIADLTLESTRLRPVMSVNKDELVWRTKDVYDQTVNQCTNPGPRIADGWSAGATMGIGATSGNPSGYTAYMTSTGSGTPYIFTANSAKAVAVGDIVTMSVTVRGDTNLDRIQINPHNNVGNVYYARPALQVITTGYTRVKQTWVADVAVPAGQLNIAALGYVNSGGTVVSGEAFYVGSAVITVESAATDGAYFDGATPNTPDTTYSWTGAANASTSTKVVHSQVQVRERAIPEIPWGTFLVSSATEDWEATGRVWSLELLDRCTVPSQDAVDQSYAVAAGTKILQQVRTILASSGEYVAIDESSTLATSSGMVWEAGTSKLTIINDLLGVAGYNALWMDGSGEFQMTPRVLPADRSIMYEILDFPRELRDGELAIYRPDWTRDRDSFDVPNKVIAIQAAGGDDAPALVGTWTNEDPTSPYSYQARGRWIPHVLDGIDCPSGSTAVITAFLQARARATLVQMSAVQAQVKVEHLPIPVSVGDVLQFAHTLADIDARHVLTRIQLDTSPLGLMKSTLQEVISL